MDFKREVMIRSHLEVACPIIIPAKSPSPVFALKPPILYDESTPKSLNGMVTDAFTRQSLDEIAEAPCLGFAASVNNADANTATIRAVDNSPTEPVIDIDPKGAKQGTVDLIDLDEQDVYIPGWYD